MLSPRDRLYTQRRDRGDTEMWNTWVCPANGRVGKDNGIQWGEMKENMNPKGFFLMCSSNTVVK